MTVTKVESYEMLVGQDLLTLAGAIINLEDKVLSIWKDRDPRAPENSGKIMQFIGR